MKISLQTKFIISFMVVIVLTGVVTTWIGIHFIEKGIIREAQRRVKMDLNSAWEIYDREMHCISHVIRLTSERFFVKSDSLWNNLKDFTDKLEAIRIKEGLDILTLTNSVGKVIIRTRNPKILGDNQANDELVGKVLREKKEIGTTQIISKDELKKESEDLVKQSLIRIILTPKAKPLKKEFETSGMMIKAASPVMDNEGKMLGVLYGGKLLNRNYSIVDKVLNTVFKDEIYKRKNIGTATIFQGDLRISTNVMNNNGTRAVGTRVSKEVNDRVLRDGKSWIGRAYVVNDWYITAYEPIRNIDNEVIGIIYVGILEQKYMDLKWHTLLIFLVITMLGIATSLIIAVILSNGITKPVKQLVFASKKLAKGDLDFKVKYNQDDEIGELGKAFNIMASSLKEREDKLKEYTEREMMRSEKLASLGQLAAGVAHEINNPIAVIMGRAEFLGNEIGDVDPVIKNSISTIEKESEKAASTVQKFLSFARQREPKRELVDINNILENSLSLASHRALMEKISVKKVLDKEILKVLGDPHQLEQVFVNIILNALHSMREGGKLSIVSEMKGDIVEIRFIDTGCGISKQNILTVFDPFFTTKKAGTGLGLAISKQIMEKHYGTINIESEPDKGTTVRIELPVI